MAVSYDEDYIVYDQFHNSKRYSKRSYKPYNINNTPDIYDFYPEIVVSSIWIYNDLRRRGFPPLMVYRQLRKCRDKKCINNIMAKYGISQYKYVYALAYFFDGDNGIHSMRNIIGGNRNVGKSWKWWKYRLPKQEIINEYNKLRDSGVKYSDAVKILANKYGVSTSTIYRIVFKYKK